MDMELRQLAPRVWACLQEERGLGTSNSGLVDAGGGLVVDTFWDLPHTRAMIDRYARVLEAPARRVVNTHHNGDHTWGNQLFPDAEIIGHRACAAAFGRERPEAMAMLRGGRDSADPMVADLARQLAPWDFTGIRPTPPTTLLDARTVLDLDDFEVRLIPVGPAHTAGDVVVHVPEAGVLFAGDVLFRLCTPIGWDGTYDGWIGALDTIIALAPDVVVPGHGPVCGLEGPREMRAYLVYVRAEARHFFERGVPALEAAARIDLGPYAGWTEPERIYFQVERAYRELRGEPWDAPYDVTTMFRGMWELRQRRAAHEAHT
jgi:glyoxylase-like metal-dependent hydrolase (beta-lactamase superfamily II)